MSDYKEIIVELETEKLVEYAKELFNLEFNFRYYIFQKGLDENNYKLAADEYSKAIQPIKQKLNFLECIILPEIPEDANYVKGGALNELDRVLGKIWRIIVANERFCNEYGGVNFTDEQTPNLYKEIYDKHLEELKEFMYYFIKISNILFSK